MSVDGLRALVEPPPRPARTDWDAVARTVGTPLPDDYRTVYDAFGSGTFDGWLALLDAGTTGPASIVGRTRQLLERRDFLGYRWPVFPEPGGYIIWGFAEPDIEVCWRTGVEPWGTAAIDRDGAVEHFELPTSVLVMQALDGTLDSTLLGPDADPETHSFARD